MEVGDPLPILGLAQQLGGGVEAVLAHVPGGVRENGPAVGLEGARDILLLLVNIAQQAEHGAGGRIGGVLGDARLEVADDLERVVLLGVLVLDEREAVGRVGGIVAVGVFLEVVVEGGEAVLVVVGEEVTERDAVAHLLGAERGGVVLEQLLVKVAGRLELGLHERGLGLGEQIVLAGLGLRELGVEFAEEVGDRLLVAFVDQRLADEAGGLFGVLRVRVLGKELTGERLQVLGLVQAVEHDEFGEGGALGLDRLRVLGADLAEAKQGLAVAFDAGQRDAAPRDERRIHVGGGLDVGQGIGHRLDESPPPDQGVRHFVGSRLLRGRSRAARGRRGSPAGGWWRGGLALPVGLEPGLPIGKRLAGVLKQRALRGQDPGARRHRAVEGERRGMLAGLGGIVVLGVELAEFLGLDDVLAGHPGEGLAHADLAVEPGEVGRKHLRFAELAEQGRRLHRRRSLVGGPHIDLEQSAQHLQGIGLLAHVGVDLGEDEGRLGPQPRVEGGRGQFPDSLFVLVGDHVGAAEVEAAAGRVGTFGEGGQAFLEGLDGFLLLLAVEVGTAQVVAHHLEHRGIRVPRLGFLQQGLQLGGGGTVVLGLEGRLRIREQLVQVERLGGCLRGRHQPCARTKDYNGFQNATGHGTLGSGSGWIAPPAGHWQVSGWAQAARGVVVSRVCGPSVAGRVRPAAMGDPCPATAQAIFYPHERRAAAPAGPVSVAMTRLGAQGVAKRTFPLAREPPARILGAPRPAAPQSARAPARLPSCPRPSIP